jgi:Ni/Co efflux regulator RcnB
MRQRPQESGQQSGGGERRGRSTEAVVAPTSPAAGDTVRNWRGRDRRADSPTQIQERNLGTVTPDADNRTIEQRNLRRVRDGSFDREVRTTPGIGGRVRRIGNNVPAEGTAPPPVSTDLARRGETTRHWDRDWHRDRRFDWHRYRDRNRSRFHLSFYFDPFGWNYRRYNIGWRLWPSYYSQDYWLNDPWQYRLPPAYGPYRCVRYYDDALLVNIYTGTVVDVIHNFFW